jgi:4-hydroxy-3-polyprenylbenzoate decarboxylase
MLPAVRACCLKTSRAIPATRSSSTSLAASGAWRMALGVDHLDEIAGPHQGPDEYEAAHGGFSTSSRCCRNWARSPAHFPRPSAPKTRRCKEVILKGRENFDLNQFPILKCWPHDGGASSRCPACIRVIRATASATSACIACRSTTARPPACTGSARRWPRSIIAKHCATRLLRRFRCRSAHRARRGDGRVGRRRVTFPDGPIGGLPQVAMGNLKGSRLEVAVAIGTDPATRFPPSFPRRLRLRSS